MGPPAKEGRSHRRRTREKDSRALNPENRSRAPQLGGLVVPRARPLEVAVPRSPTPPAPPRPAVNQQVPPLRARPTQLLSSHLRGTFWPSPFGAITNQSPTAVSAVFCVKRSFPVFRIDAEGRTCLAGRALSACRVLRGPPTACPGHLHRAPAPSRMPGQRARGPALLSVASTRRCPDPPCSVPI